MFKDPLKLDPASTDQTDASQILKKGKVSNFELKNCL